MNKVIATKEAPAAIGPYSQAQKAGGFLFTSGQIPLDPKTGNFVSGSIQEQATQVLENLKQVLLAANMGFDDVVKTTVFLTSMEHFAAVNEVYGRYFHTNLPARSCVAVAELPKGALVEIELVAFQNSNN
ncbi:RidA family protein [Anaeromusa acidaminophila]|uniref:RidA family protein n=1 Tax=Anaeromusa acidaminophila TaxID=81464 RepID=UPI00035F7CA9|nr:RidA family protein [Anaeromusa acidaminophila]